MAEIEIWHNPRCSKSRRTLELLRNEGVEPKVVEYLKSPPSAKRLGEVLSMLSMEPRDLMRKKEKVYGELGLAEVNAKRELIAAMIDHPILIERPVIIAGRRAALGRPPENALELLR